MHPGTLRQQKQSLRAHMRTLLAQVTPEARAAMSARVTDAILSSTEWRDAAVVCAFCGTASEIDTEALCRAALDQGKRLALPRVTGESLAFSVVSEWPFAAVAGALGIPEPAAAARPLHLLSGPPSERPDEPQQTERPILVITPGLAFDRRGGRLGRGGGYYDRFFDALRSAAPAEVQPSWRSVAVAFAFQLVDAVPMGEWDRRVHAVATDLDGLIRIAGGGAS